MPEANFTLLVYLMIKIGVFVYGFFLSRLFIDLRRQYFEILGLTDREFLSNCMIFDAGLMLNH